MYDLIAIGDVTIDLFFSGGDLSHDKDTFSFTLGDKYLADSFFQGVGGAATNIAVGLAHYGLQTGLVAGIGDNAFQQIIIRHLTKKFVSTEFLLHQRDTLNISTVLLAENGQRTVIHYPSAVENFELSDILMGRIAQSQYIYCGNIQSIEVSEKVALLTKLKQQEKFIILNLGTREINLGLKAVSPLLSLASMVFMNTSEYSELAGKKKDVIDFQDAKDIYSTLGITDCILVITDGEKGAYGYDGKDTFFQKAVDTKKIVDTTGAGDGFASGFIASYIQHKDIQKALQEGSSYAAVIIGKMGAN